MPRAYYNIDGEMFLADSQEEAYQQHAEKHAPGIASGLIQSFNQGISMGGADELQAAAEAALGGKYDDSWKRQQDERARFSRAHPWLSATATAAGAITPTVMATLASAPAGGVGGIPVAARGLQLVRNALSGSNVVNSANTTGQAIREGVRTGVAYGAPAGYLSSEEQGAGARTVSGVKGAVVGGGLGGALPAAAGLYGAADRFASPYLRRAVDYFGLNRANVSPMSTMRTPQTPNEVPLTSAEGKILNALEDAGMTPSAAGFRLQEASDLGVPMGLIDVGGQPTQRMARGVRTLPGEGSAVIDRALHDRAAGQAGRVVNFLERGVGRTADPNGQGVSNSLLRRARGESNPLYRQVEQLGGVKSAEVRDMFTSPYVRELMQARESSQAALMPRGAPAPRSLYNPDGSLRRLPTFDEVDYIKQTIGDVLKPSYNRTGQPLESVNVGLRDSRARLGNFQSSLVKAADAAPGGEIYSNARAAYAGPAQARDAYDAGREFPKASFEDIVSQRSASTPAERKWYDRGVVSALRENIEGMPDLATQPNRLRSFYGSINDRRNVDSVVNPRRLEDFRSRMQAENQTAQTNNVVRGGSQTADKAAEAMDVAADLVVDAATSGPRAAVANQIDRLVSRFRSAADSSTRSEIAKHLTNFNPEQQQAFLARLERLQAAGRLRAAEVANEARAVAIQSQTTE